MGQSPAAPVHIATRDPATPTSGPEGATAVMGMTLANYSAELDTRYSIPHGFPAGPVVTGIEARSPALHAGLAPGDVIVMIGTHRVANARVAKDLFDRSERDKDIRLYVLTSEGMRFMVLHK